MQVLGNFQVADQELAPVVVVICFDTATRSVQFVLSQDAATTVPYIKYDSRVYENFDVLDDVVVTSTQPDNGGGIIRRSTTLTVLTENPKGYPYYQGVFSKKFYQGGLNVRDFYFGIYAIDRRMLNEEIRTGLFLGYFQIQTGASWTEREGKTTLPLVDVLTNDDTLVGATEEVIPDSLFLFNPWFNEQIVPKVWGQVARVKLLNSFPSFSVRTLSSALNGRVESNYTNASTSILLEKYADQSSVLRQLITVGGTVKVKMADGEVIAGTLSYNSGTGEVTLNITQRNTYYDIVQGYTYAGVGQDPTQWQSVALLDIQNIPSTWSKRSSVILDGKNRIQDPNGWMQATLAFFDDSLPTKSYTAEVTAQMEGWDNEADNVIKHTQFVDSIGNASTLSYIFQSHAYGVVQTGLGTLTTWSWIAGQYLEFDPNTRPVKLWFRNPTTATGGGSIGDSWQIVNIAPAATTYECYIRNGFSHFDANHVYCEGDGRLVKIPPSKIVSVTDSTTVGTLSNMAKIILTSPPLDMGIGATSNIVYVDALYRTGTNEARSERVMYEVLKESSLIQHLLGSNITTTLPTNNFLPYFGYLARRVETVSEILDRLLFQLGATLRCRYDKYGLEWSGRTHSTEAVVTIGGNAHIRPLASHIDENEMLLEATRVEMGQFKTKVDSAGYEFIPFYFDVDYGAWEDPYYKPVKSGVNRAIKPYERKFDYAFDLIQDAASANYAIGSALSIGHPSGFASIERSFGVDCTMYAARFEALDPIVLRNFPLITTADETNATFDSDGAPCYLRPSDQKKFLMGALCQVTNAVYDFSVDNPKVTLTAKMAQTFVQANGISVARPPYPPALPPSPPSDPNNPPNPNGGTIGGWSYSGSATPMDATVTTAAPIVINSTAAELTTFDIDISDFSAGSGGWSYYVTVHPEDGLDTGYEFAATVSGGGFGTFPNKLNDSYTTPAQTTQISVSYEWFFGLPATVSRPVVVRIHRIIPYIPAGDVMYEDTIPQTVRISVTLQDLSDITAS